jgi:hypothetical protein
MMMPLRLIISAKASKLFGIYQHQLRSGLRFVPYDMMEGPEMS